jgi:uncharacterized protein GlcG (DUF336 family)
MRRKLAALSVLLAALTTAGCERHTQAGTTTYGDARETGEHNEELKAGRCDELPDAAQLLQLVRKAPTQGEAGGLFGGRFEWIAVVNRQGEICATVASQDDRSAPWPGSEAIAEAKAFTANAFSTDQAPMSTARLYTLSQPGHSLWGAGAGNPFNPECLRPPKKDSKTHRVCGGTIVFGGGVPLYRNGVRVGGLGASGDTACADHEIAKRIREAAALAPGAGNTADDIQYSSVDGASVFTHPLCVNTWRNGTKIGEEPPANGY